MSRSNADKLREMYRRFWDERDWSVGAEVLSPDIEWHGFDEIGLGGVYHGVTGVGQFFREWLEVWEDTSNPIDLYEISPEVIVVVSHWRGRAKATGLLFEREIAQVYEFEDGKAIRQRMFASEEEARRAAEAAH